MRAALVSNLALVALVALGAPAAAQIAALPGAGREPVEIVARNGIEWHRDQQRYVARGAARLTQGDRTIEAEMLTALYRQPEGGQQQVYRFLADGDVKLTTASQRATGERGVYDVDAGVFVLTGNNLKITSPDQQLTARDSLEYWDQRRVAVARGDAIAVTADGKRFRGDTLTAYFDPAPAQGAGPRVASAAPRTAVLPLPGAADGGQKLKRIDAVGNVIVTSPTEIAQGDRGVYDATSGIATLAGNVRLTRGQNQMNGDFLEINLNTGVSKLMTRPGPEGAEPRVRGLFIPGDQDGVAAPKPATPPRVGGPRR